MGRKIVIDAQQQARFKNIVITYPFCIKSGNEKSGYNYFRYLEDGRYEYIFEQDLKMHFSYGNQINSIQGLANNDEFWYKVLLNNHERITSEEFESKRADFFSRYEDYLSGARYIAKQVEQIIAKQKNHYEIKNENQNEGIIINKEHEDDPF